MNVYIAGYEAGEQQGVPDLVTEYVVGADLQTLVVQRGPMAVEHAAETTIQAARSLMQLHCLVFTQAVFPAARPGRNRSRVGGAGCFLRCMRGGQSHFRGLTRRPLGQIALCAAKIGTVPCERLRPGLVAAYLFVFEYNIHSASILGAVGAGGIGQDLMYDIESREFPPQPPGWP